MHLTNRHLRAALFSAVVTGSVAPPLAAQIIGVEVTDAKLIKDLKKQLVERHGKQLILGEPWSGLVVDFGKTPTKFTIPPNTQEIAVLVPDTARPELELVRKNKKGERTLLNKKFELKLPLSKISNSFQVVFPHQSLEGMREEYLRKKALLLELEAEVAALALGTPEWFSAHRRFLTQVDGMIGWLDSTLYPEAARALEKDLKKRGEKAAKESSEQRFLSAKETLKESPVPEKLTASAASFGAPASFLGAETRHLRAFAHSGVAKSDLENGLVTGERIVEGFRAAIVDPTLGADEADPIPESLFQEYFLCPDDIPLSVRYFEEYYGKSLGKDANRQRAIETTGHAGRGAFGVDFLEFWRYGDGSDFEGIVAHRLGHALASLAFARGGEVPAWLAEGMAYWTSYEFIAHNTVTCIAFTLPTYEKSKQEKEGLKPIEEGMRAAFNSLALAEGPPIGQLLRKKLVEMDAASLAKSWSVVDWVLAEHRLKARALFSAACRASKDERTDLEDWRPKLQEILGTQPGQDAYKVMEESWRSYAQVGQQRPGDDRKR